MVDVDAFLLGMKPALYGNTGSPTLMKNIDDLMKYPYITQGIDIFDGEDFFLFFQDEKKMNEFVIQLEQVVSRSPAFHEILGDVLGYPPLATRFYAKCMEDETLNHYRLSIRYAGIRCTSHVAELTQNAIWLWDRYHENENMKILIESKFYTVDRGDIRRLEEIQKIKLA
ncbi:hypothetical protein MK805_07410 [Shimazuella sp. AN120528]|uniref:hypothetical protein n=1 Tax=Shimazuella soli TaxID=1892854 RepID=UPI001F0FD23B|nr:hypothetical protein [Shimazuella soli]MCH5584799.1 hypothetical protein [Shimazuella soli]